jgi:thiol-disulfide isomerase/thioredoxin
MRCTKAVGGLLAIVLSAPFAWGADPKPAESLAGLKKEVEASWEELARGRGPGTTEAEQKAAVDRYYKQSADIARRALVLAEANPGAPEAAGSLVLIIEEIRADAECDAAYDRLARHYLDRELILPVIRTAWASAYKSGHAEAFLRAAVEKSPNLKVRALACFSLGRLLQEQADTASDLDSPFWSEVLEKNLGPETVRRLRTSRPEDLRREAEALYGRTLREFADLRPMGGDFPPLGEQAEGALFRLDRLAIGRDVPEIEGEDLDGRPCKLSEIRRGKVVMISFWATWCGPCMGMVPDERTLVEKMKGRPFVLVGVNGDEDRAQAKSVAAREGMTWRSFWGGGPFGPLVKRWGVKQWPTIYLVDARGVIRAEGLRGPNLDKAVEALVAEAEAEAGRRP